MSPEASRPNDPPAEIPRELSAVLPGEAQWTTLHVLPHRLDGLLLSAFARTGFETPSIRQRDRTRGQAVASKIVRIRTGTYARLELFEYTENICELLVAWRSAAPGQFQLGWVARYPQGFQAPRLKRNAAELLAKAWKDLSLEEFARILYSLGFNEKQLLQAPRGGESLQQKIRDDAIRETLIHWSEQERAEAANGYPFDTDLTAEFGEALLSLAGLEPPLPPSGPYVLGPGEAIDLDRLAMAGSLAGDYSGFATEREVADLAFGVLPVGRWAFGAAPDTMHLGRRLYLWPENIAFQGALIVAPSGRGKTHLLKRWAEAAHSAGYSMLIVDVKGDLYQELSGRLRGPIGYFATDRTIPPGVAEPGRERSDRLNLLRGLDWTNPLHRDDIFALADVLLPSKGWKDAGGQAERAFRARRALLKNLIVIALMRAFYKPGSWNGREPDLGNIFEMAADESLLVEAIADIETGEANAGSRKESGDFSIGDLIREIKHMVSPPPRGAAWGARAGDESYSDYTFGVTDALRAFAPGTSFHQKIRSEGPGKLFEIDALAGAAQTTLILAARGTDGEAADAVLSFTIKRVEQILLSRFKDAQARPVLLLLDETARIREFDPLDFVSISRQSRTAAVLVYQGIAKIPEQRRQDLLTTIGTQIYLGDVPHPMIPQVQQGLPTRNPTPRLGPNPDPNASPIPIHGGEPVPALGALELGKLKSGERPAIVYIRDHPSGKPIPVSLYEETPKALSAGTKNFPSLQAAIDAAAPGARIRIEPGKYKGDLKISKPLELDAASRGTVTLEGTLLIISVRDDEIFPPVRAGLRNLEVGTIDLGASIRLELDDCEIGSVKSQAPQTRVAARRCKIGVLTVDARAGSIDVSDSSVSFLEIQEVERAALVRCQVRCGRLERLFEEFDDYNESSFRPYKDGEERPPYQPRIETRDCRLEETKITEVDFTAVDCVFLPRVLEISDSWADDRHTTALEIDDGNISLTGGSVHGAIVGRCDSFEARGVSLGEPLAWPGGVAPVGFENFSDILALDSRKPPLRLNACTINLRSLEAATAFESLLTAHDVELESCRAVVPCLPPGAPPLNIPDLTSPFDFRTFATEEEAEPLCRGILPIGHWAFREESGSPRRGRRLYLPHLPVTALTLPAAAEIAPGVARILGYWAEAANAAGWSVVVLAGRKSMPGPPLRISGPSWGVSLAPRVSGDLQSLLSGFDLLRGLTTGTPAAMERIAQAIDMIDALQTTGGEDAKRVAMALSTLILQSSNHEPELWHGRHPDFGDVYDAVASRSRRETLRTSAGPLPDASLNEVLDGFETDSTGIRSRLIRMLRPFAPDEAARPARLMNVAQPPFPLWALTTPQPVTLLIDFPLEPAAQPAAALALRLLAGVLRRRAAAIPDHPLLLIIEDLPEIAQSAVRSIAAICKHSEARVAFAVSDPGSMPKESREALLASADAFLEVGTRRVNHWASLRFQKGGAKPVLLDLEDPEPVIAPAAELSANSTYGRDYSSFAAESDVSNLADGSGTLPIGRWAFDDQRGPLLFLPSVQHSLLVMAPDLLDASRYLGHWVRMAIARSGDSEEYQKRAWKVFTFGSHELAAALPLQAKWSSDRIVLPAGPTPEIPQGSLESLNPIPWMLSLYEPDRRKDVEWVERIARILGVSDEAGRVLSALILLSIVPDSKGRHIESSSIYGLAAIALQLNAHEYRAKRIRAISEAQPAITAEWIAQLKPLDTPGGPIERELLQSLKPFYKNFRTYYSRFSTESLAARSALPDLTAILTTPGNASADAAAALAAKLLMQALEQRDRDSYPLLLIVDLRDALRHFDLAALFAAAARSRTLLVLAAQDLAAVPDTARPALLDGAGAWLHLGSLPLASATALAVAGQIDATGLERFGSLPVARPAALFRSPLYAKGKPLLLDVDWNLAEMRKAGQEDMPGALT